MKKIKLKALAFFLCFAMLLPQFPIALVGFAADADTGDFDVFYDGKPTDSVTVPYNERIVLSVEEDDDANYAWQILIDDETDEWVNISGQKKCSLVVGAALVSSVADKNGTAYVRCKKTVGTSQSVSGAVKVTLTATVTEKAATNAAASATAPVRRTAKAATNPSDVARYSITVNYVYEDGSSAFDPYSANIAAGEDFEYTVHFPTVVGYLPYFGSDGESTSQYKIDIKSIDKDYVYTVTYKPTAVKFKVNHYKQNVLDDQYELFRTTEESALTGQPVGDGHTIEIDGFTAIYYDKDVVVAADGSTEISIYYDRNYYLITFELGGGYGTDPVYTRYGATVSVNAPQRSGYLFTGWQLIECGRRNEAGQTVYSQATEEEKGQYSLSGGHVVLPDMNLKYLALWTTSSTTYSIVYWKENANDNGYSYWGSRVVGAKADGTADGTVISGSSVSGSDDVPVSVTTTVVDGESLNERDYFTYNSAKTDKNVIVEGDGSTVVNVYYTRNVYYLYFTGISGTCVLKEHTHSTDCSGKLICTITAHTHDESCEKTLVCPKAEHTQHTDECLICNKTEHANHTKACYSGVGTKAGYVFFAPSNPEQGYVYQSPLDSSRYYIYVDGSWYSYSGDIPTSGNIAPTTCDGIHVHGEECYKDALHTHTDACYTYSCNTAEHIHTAECYAKCTKLEHKHTTSCNSASTSNVIYVIGAKYEQTIGDEWPTADKFPNVTLLGWDIDGISSNTVSKRINMTSDLCDKTDNLKYAKILTGGTKKYLYYMFESFDQTSPADGNDRKLYKGVYYDKSELYYQEVNSNGTWNQKEILGMNPVDGGVVTSGSDVFLYYTRNRHVITFHSVGKTVKTVSDVMYQTPFSSIKDGSGNAISTFAPEYPETYEPNAYYFAGWYATPECFEGTEVDFTKAVMPNSDTALYAKWAPKTHTVNIYKTYDDLQGEKTPVETERVLHGNVAKSPEALTNGNYTFGGWFYMDGNEKKAFDFNNMPVNRDLDIFAEWNSKVAVVYTIHYQTKDGTKIAPDTVGSTLAGTSKTFTAKGGAELYEAYRTGYYPSTNSHTLVMSLNGTNEFTFVYEVLDAAPYVVRYLEKGSEKVLADEERHPDNKSSVVTEVFKVISGYAPDAYQKRLVLSVNSEENVITFWYEKDEIHAYYLVTHWVQNVEGDGYSEYRTIQGPDTIGATVTEDPIAITGFNYVGYAVNGGTRVETASEAARGTLEATGLKLNLYYDRNTFDYTVKYLEYGTERELAATKTSSRQYRYGSTVTETALDITGYTRVGDKTKIRTIRGKDDVIVFYYTEQTVMFKYVPVGGGYVSLGSENINAKTGTPSGSTPTANPGYVFDGWYLDEECKTPVKDGVNATTSHVTPQKNGEIYVSTTYYAKFVASYSQLTIAKQGADSVDENQTFIFTVRGTDAANSSVVLTFTVHGNGKTTITDLPTGNYEVTEVSEWSWRYSPETARQTVAVTVEAPPTVTFKNVRSQTKWLDGDNYRINPFDALK